MKKNMLIFYTSLIFTLLLFINIFPNIFYNINNSFDFLKIKTELIFNKNNEKEIFIYQNKANIIVMFDDGWKTQYTKGFKYMEKKNMRGSIAIISNAIDQSMYLNKGELNELHNKNWDLLNHTCYHNVLINTDISEQEEEIKQGGDWLKEKGFNNQNNILIYPEGKYNSDTIDIMKKLNYVSGRSVEDGYNFKYPKDLYRIKVKNVLTTTKTEWVESWIDYAIANNLTLILLFHKIENETDDSKMIYKEKDFNKIIDYIDKNREKLNIITYSEWIQTVIHYQNEKP
jgi:peptidoglycan/xylan/chitin deacetylase (PgdA/CDA1 family)